MRYLLPRLFFLGALVFNLSIASLEDHTYLQCVCMWVGTTIHKMSSGDCGCMCPVYNGKYNTHVLLCLNLTSCDALQMVQI